MREIRLKTPTTFRNNELEEINIYQDGKLFYSSKYLNKNPEFFNLPAGDFQTENFISVAPLSIPKIKLPKKERHIKSGENYEIRFEPNPNKCTVYHDQDLIVFDESFKNKPEIEILCVYYHELGHRFYETEYKCDIYSYYRLLKLGYNPSQIKQAFQNTLSHTPAAYHRKMKYFNKHNKK